jgi:hypothetical protein
MFKILKMGQVDGCYVPQCAPAYEQPVQYYTYIQMIAAMSTAGIKCITATHCQAKQRATGIRSKQSYVSGSANTATCLQAHGAGCAANAPLGRLGQLRQ